MDHAERRPSTVVTPASMAGQAIERLGALSGLTSWDVVPRCLASALALQGPG